MNVDVKNCIYNGKSANYIRNLQEKSREYPTATLILDEIENFVKTHDERTYIRYFDDIYTEFYKYGDKEYLKNLGFKVVTDSLLEKRNDDDPVWFAKISW